MSHYYTNDYKKSNKRTINIEFNNKSLAFVSDSNVFSKNEIDFGSLFLTNTIINDNIISGKALDIGCGYGAITILLATHFLNTSFFAVDINERAVNLTIENAKLNHLDNRVFASVGNVCSNITEKDFDFVVSNPPIRAGNEILFKFFQQSFERLKNGGYSYWVFRKQQGAETYTKKLSEIYQEVEVLDKKKSFWVVRAKKIS